MTSSLSWLCVLLMELCLVSNAVGWRRELTTRSLDVLGFHENMPRSPYEDQIIVAVVDSGIWPESPSFNDKDLGPPPAKWKGVCDTGNSSMPFKCNNKIIGARAYYPDGVENVSYEDRSPRDTTGHGSHVAAILAGVPVKNASLGGTGIGLGTSRGVVPRARIAVYKVCWFGSCNYFSRGIRDAIVDGADIISMSVGTWPWPFGSDGSSFASFAAVQKGIFLSFSGGNNSTLNQFTVNNVMPWVTTVGNSAGSGTDFVTYVTLGDGKRFEGVVLNIFDDGNNTHPLILNEEVTNTTSPDLVTTCVPEYMNPEAVKGKIIMCYDTLPRTKWQSYDFLNLAGLLVNGEDGYYESAREDYTLRPQNTRIAVLKGPDYKYLRTYYETSKKTGQIATANIAKTVNFPDTPPRTAKSNCRGPNLMDLNILKPDLSAPGVNVISAVPGDSAYDGMTGTSMAAPLLSGVAAYIKSFHPTWSPAAIKSALMTTAKPMSDPYRNSRELAYGTGQVDPVRAVDPGLVYDIDPKDYLKYLCQWSHSSTELLYNVTKNSSDNCAKIQIEQNWQLNYPSFSVPVFADQPFVKVFQRTLTNVGNTSAVDYKAVVNVPWNITVKVEPSVLTFTQVGQSLPFTVTVQGVLPKRNVTSQTQSAYIVWNDGCHKVRSPIVIFERPVNMTAQALKTIGLPYSTPFYPQ